MLLDFRRLGKFDFPKASSFAEYEATLPPLGCDLHNLGESSDPTKNVYGVSYGKLDGSKPVLYFEGVIHGDHEWRAAHYLYKFMEMIANPHDTPLREFVLKVTNTFDIYTIPCVNPYGYEMETYTNANDVNLNRNFDYNWTPEPKFGSGPFSEPETQIIKSVFEQYKPILFVDYHTLGGYQGYVTAPGSTDGSSYLRMGSEVKETIVYNTLLHPARLHGPDDRPTSRSWASSQVSSLGSKTFAFMHETGSLESGEMQCTSSLYSAFIFCAYALNWYKYGTLDITEDVVR